MKRGGPIERRTPLRSKTALKRGGPIGRRRATPASRSGAAVRSLPAPGAAAWWRKAGSGLKAFPGKVLALLKTRDEWCQRCGSPGPLHSHHRRAKGIGGDTRPHSQCACNGVRLCSVDRLTGEIGGCHLWVHLYPEQARDEGWIVEQEVTEPSQVKVRRGSPEGVVISWPTCDGQWASEPPASAEAAA